MRLSVGGWAENGMKILLASRSPRRKQLLLAAGFDFETIEPGVEPPASDVPARLQCIESARQKALGAAFAEQSGLLLAVDTVVSLEGHALGKPRDADEAARFLALLEGREHSVLTAHAHAGVEKGRPGEIGVLVTEALVFFRELTVEERAAYLAAGDWRDKAGGYGIQSDASAFARLTGGQMDTVVGLSLQALREILSSRS